MILRRAAAVGLLAGPAVLAFCSGGYYENPRAWAGAIAWALVALALLAGGRLPRGGPGWLALGGLTALTGLALASLLWAPIAGDALDAAQIDLLYLGALLGAALLLADPGPRALAEPVLWAGGAVVIGYAVAGRVLPGVIHEAASAAATGRLAQPLTYWNATGELATLALVLACRLAGDPARPRWLRALAAASGPLLGLGLYASFSRGALFAAVAGLIALIAAAPTRAQLRGGACALAGAVVAGAALSPLHGVTSLHGSLAHREGQGLIALAVLLALGLMAAAAGERLTRGADAPLRLPARTGLVAGGLIVLALAGALYAGARESHGAPRLAGGAARLETLQSDRFAYWTVALDTYARHPLAGIGAGNWQVSWLAHRSIDTYAVDAHSLELQTLAELGTLGGLALLALFLGVAETGRRALLAGSPRAPAGAVAVLVAYLVHSPLDWDWQMPALTLVAIVLAGALLADLGHLDGPGGGRPVTDPVASRA